MRRLGVFVALIAVLFACRSVTAQSVGDRVRVTTAVDTIIGNLAQTGEYGLTLGLGDGESREFTHAEIQRLELHKKKHRRDKWVGLGFGLLLGTTVARHTEREREVAITVTETDGDEVGCLVMALFLQGCGRTTRHRTTHVQEISTAGYIAMVAGPVLGFIVGHIVPPDKWETVPSMTNSPETQGRFSRTSNRLVLSPIVDAQPDRDGRLKVMLGMRVRF